MTVREHVLQTFGADMLQLIDSLQPTDVRECALYLLYRSEFIILAASTYAYARGRIDRVGGESMEDYCDRHACAFLRHAFHDCSQRQVYEPPESVGHLMEAVRARYEGTHYTRALSVLAMAMLAGLDQPDDEAEQLRGYLRDVHALIMVGVRLDLRAAGILRD